MLHHRVPVAPNVPARHCPRVLGVLVAKSPARHHRRRRAFPIRMAFLPGGPVVAQIPLHLVPRLLGYHQHTHAQLRHNAAALRRNRRRVAPPPETAERVGPYFPARLPDILPLKLAETALQPRQQALGRLDKPRAGFVHIHPETVILHLRQPTPHAQYEPPVAQIVQHCNLLGHPHRVVPGQHAHHAPQPQIRRAPGHIGEKLQHIRAHRVIREMMLHPPDGLETQRLGQVGQTQFLAINPVIGSELARVLKNGGGSYVHFGASGRRRNTGGAALRWDTDMVRVRL